MATWADIERISLGLPETSAGRAWNRPAFLVRKAWFVLDRGPAPDAVDEAGERIEGLIVLYTADEEAKLRLAGDHSGYFLTTPHFDRSRMILVHLDRIPVDELAEVIIESWLVKAPKRLGTAYLESLPEPDPADGLEAQGWTVVEVRSREGESPSVTQAAIATALRLHSAGEGNLEALPALLGDLHLRWPGVNRLALVWRGVGRARAVAPTRTALLIGMLEDAQVRVAGGDLQLRVELVDEV